MSLTQALRDLIARYEYDGIPNDSLPTVGAARVALAEGEVRGSVFGEVVVTRNAAGSIVLVSRQDADGRILSVIAEAGKWGVRKLGVGMSAGECIICGSKAEADQQAADYGGDVVPLTYENGHWGAPATGGVTTCREPEPLKDHEIALIVNELRDIAKTYGQTQQLRQRIADVIVPRLRRYGVKPTAGVLAPGQGQPE